ncbi:hypothetical protein JQ596_33830 [Bradyrhizobium manausense]|uniref:hypothetical protein n=1 Tax=Bradyrhizobium TaxID=374 RepID=UPI001BA7A208|nr:MULTISPECIES: hypothetical protein [Bradyrhizobium]MBR0830500.1 hypothetical protein [Bradyrhizobium manausense]UVO28268.1 hypothetical protein KUF59_38360 [Bradyrhizobium arachidis]
MLRSLAWRPEPGPDTRFAWIGPRELQWNQEAVAASEFECLIGTWGHSREEDANGVMVLRPQGFVFPPSRGRDWFEFHADGTVLFLGAGLDDRTRARNGSWSRGEGASLHLFRPAETIPQHLTIVECTDKVLKLRAD